MTDQWNVQSRDIILLVVVQSGYGVINFLELEDVARKV